MMTKKQSAHALRVGDEAVKVTTRKTWAQWFAALDRAAPARMRAFWGARLDRLRAMLESTG